MTSEEPAAGTRAAETRARILRAAMELFAQEGFDRTSVRSIAERCGLTDAALYYYFRSKRAILNALFDGPELGVIRDLSVAPVLNRTALERLVDVMLDASADFETIGRVIVKQALLDDQTALALRNQTLAYWRVNLLPHFEVSFPTEDAALRVDALMMLFLGVVMSGQMDHEEDYVAQLHNDEYRRWVRNMAVACIPVAAGA